MNRRPLRFGLSIGDFTDRDDLAAVALRAEAAGYSTVLIADHLGSMAPFLVAAYAAEATTTARIGTHVLNNDFRHPAFVAHEAATLDVLSGGRLELGIGAGWAVDEYRAAGIDFDRGGIRVQRLAESAEILRRLFAGGQVEFVGDHYSVSGLELEPPPAQQGGPPILIGGNGDRLLAVAGRLADIAQFTGFTAGDGSFDLSRFSTAALAASVDRLRDAAGTRFDEMELSVLVQRVVITDDREAAAADRVAAGADPAWVLDSPYLLIGDEDEVESQIRALRDDLGISYFVVFDGRAEGFDSLVTRLTGT